MLHINKNFKTVDKDKKIIWSILGSFFVVSVILLIVTSWFSNDLAITNAFSKGMKYDVIRWISAFTIADGFNALVSYAVPLGILVLESLYVYLKQKKSKVISKTVYGTIFCIIYVLIFATFEYFTIRDIPYFYGFGKGQQDGFNIGDGKTFFVYARFLSGWEFYSIYVVSVVINNVIAISLLSYIHFGLSKRKDFLDKKYWLKSIQGLIYIGFLYIMYEELAHTMRRPHPYRVRWSDFLYDMRTVDNGKYLPWYENYIHQKVFNYGWIEDGWTQPFADGTYNNRESFPGDWAWWKNGTPLKGHYRNDSNFPSGHVNELCIALNALMIIFSIDKNEKNSKKRTLRMSLFGVMIVWWLTMIFSMLIGQGHWMSDMAFSFVWALPAYFLSWLVTLALFKWLPESKWFKQFDFENWYSLFAVLLMMGTVVTSGLMVGQWNGEKFDELSICQAVFGIVLLLITSIELSAMAIKKNLNGKFESKILEIFVYTLSTIIGILAYIGIRWTIIFSLESLTLALSVIALLYSASTWSIDIANKFAVRTKKKERSKQGK